MVVESVQFKGVVQVEGTVWSRGEDLVKTVTSWGIDLSRLEAKQLSSWALMSTLSMI